MNYPIILALNLTKNRFLCAFVLRNPRFQAFRAQKRGFCALLGSGTPVFEHFEHKIGGLVSAWAIFPRFSALQSTKSAFFFFFYRRRLRGCWPGGGKCGLWEEKSAHVLGLRAFTNLSCCSECRSTWSASPPPAGQETKSRGTKAGERRAGERRAGGFTGGRG